MKRQANLAALLIGIVLVFSVPSHADSDGYFCTGKGYVAFEVREGVTPRVSGHILNLVRFGSDSSIKVTARVTLPDFQVHAMSCAPDSVVISGWDKVFNKCLVEIASPQETGPAECDKDRERRFDYRKEGKEPPTLGELARPGSITLESLDPDHTYQLILSGSSKKVGVNSWEVRRKAEVVQIDPQGHVAQRLVVYQTRIVAPNSCGS
ncbi:MAG TPA: hypothetical protein VNW47_09250 [Terriglobales bacterium]|jgi:hypothetical protein|nr:hypothetical protein [Terriglobales bacterium]